MTKGYVYGLVVLVLVGCTGIAGPSDEKVRQDIEDALRRQTGDLVTVSELRLNRKAVAEDRVEVQVTATYTLDQERYRVYAERTKRMDAMQQLLGGHAVILGRAKGLDGKKDEFTVTYRLQGNKTWAIAKSMRGHS